MRQIHLLASGIVQGVGFRAFCIRVGTSLSLVGYAKNLENGSVEIIAEGKDEQLAQFIRRINVKLTSGIHVKELRTLEDKKISEASYSSFGVEY